MLNPHRTLLCIFLILFLFSMHSDVLAQSGQNSDTKLSESQYIKLLEEIRKIDTNISQTETKITEKIAQLETNLRAHVDEKSSEVSKNISELKSDVSYINGQLSIIKWVVTIIGAPILVSIIINFVQDRRYKTPVATVNQDTEDDAESGTTPTASVGEVS